MKTVWKNIENFHGYQVSNKGQVKSFKQDKKTGKILKEKLCNSGYLSVVLCNENNKPIFFHIHRLVAKTFIENQENKKIVDHIDGDKTNNYENNLRWCTQAENCKFYRTRFNKMCASEKFGVSFNKTTKKWTAQIRMNGNQNYLGTYNTENEAHEVYLYAEQNGVERTKRKYGIKKQKPTSKYKGVSWSKNLEKWVSNITVDGKRHYLGMFTSEQEAYEARLKHTQERHLK